MFKLPNEGVAKNTCFYWSSLWPLFSLLNLQLWKLQLGPSWHVNQQPKNMSFSYVHAEWRKIGSCSDPTTSKGLQRSIEKGRRDPSSGHSVWWHSDAGYRQGQAPHFWFLAVTGRAKNNHIKLLCFWKFQFHKIFFSPPNKKGGQLK